MNRDYRENRIRQLEVNNRILCLIIGILLAVIFFGSYYYYSNKQKAVPIDTAGIVSDKIPFKANPKMKKHIQDNYIKYLNMAYILIGDYPNCEYIKISANVTRNDYNWNDDFYVDEKGLYYNYFKDGKKAGKIAVDVSEFQNTINWESVKAAGVDVAMIRIGYRGYGEGTLMPDHMATENLDGAKKAGIETGVYFFSSAINMEEGQEEAKFVLEMQVSTALITADTYRISAVEQLKTYSDILGLPLEIVYSSDALQQAIKKHSDKKLILIDTAGRSQYNDFQMKELCDLLSGDSDIEKHLVLSSTTKNRDAEEILAKFGPCQPERVIFTKTDETSSLGLLLNLLYKRKIALSYVTNGQSVPDDIIPASFGKLADMLLR